MVYFYMIQKMNDFNDNYACDLKQGSCKVIKTPREKKL